MSNVQEFKDLLNDEEDDIVTAPESKVPQAIVEALDTTPSDLVTSSLEKGILEHALQGINISSTAFSLGIPESYIRTYLRKPKVREYLQELKGVMAEIDQLMLTDTLRKIVGSRIEDMEDDDEASYSTLTKKDTLDVIKVFSEMTNNITKGQKEEKETTVFNTIYQQVMRD